MMNIGRTKTYKRHHPDCIVEAAWDVPEAYHYCSCTAPYPFSVCASCHRRPHQHAKDCPNRIGIAEGLK